MPPKRQILLLSLLQIRKVRAAFEPSKGEEGSPGRRSDLGKEPSMERPMGRGRREVPCQEKDGKAWKSRLEHLDLQLSWPQLCFTKVKLVYKSQLSRTINTLMEGEFTDTGARVKAGINFK